MHSYVLLPTGTKTTFTSSVAPPTKETITPPSSTITGKIHQE
jgi:hypothetical protein